MSVCTHVSPMFYGCCVCDFNIFDNKEKSGGISHIRDVDYVIYVSGHMQASPAIQSR